MENKHVVKKESDLQTDDSDEKLSKDELETFENLINLGFDEQLSFEAVINCGGNLNKCIEYIEKNNEKKKEVYNDTDRINYLLTNTKRECDYYALLESIYSNLNNSNESIINNFINDYILFISQIDNNPNIQIMQHKNNKCKLTKCDHIRRRFMDQNEGKGCETMKDKENEILEEMCDNLHLYKYHIFDLGFKTKQNNENEQKNHNQDNQVNSGKRIKEIKQNMIKYNQFNQSKQRNNKFVTVIETQNDDEKNIENPIKYGFGKRFFYHSYYQNKNKTKSEIIPGRKGMAEYGSSDNKPFSDWYVKAFHSNLKDEILNGEIAKLSMDEYQITYLKAKWKWNALKNKINKAYVAWEKVYEIPKDSIISLQHLLSIILYTDWNSLCYEFSKSFRKIKQNESDKELILRHSKYGNMARLIREAVECFGIYMANKECKFDQVYHGINCQMVFDSFQQKFYVPTSTTLSENIAIGFAGIKGVVLTIKNTKSATPYFNCIPFSKFPWEQEMLFIGGRQRLEINGMIDMTEDISYNIWIQSMKVFTNAATGQPLSSPIEPIHKEKIRTLLNDIESVPIYIQSLFKHLCQQTVQIQIDITRFNKDIYYICPVKGNRYGFIALKDFFFDNMDGIKYHFLQNIFSNAKIILFTSTIKTKERNKYQYISSIKVSEEWLLQMLNILNQKNNSWKQVIVYSPNNSKHSLQKLITQYSSIFTKSHIQIGSKENHSHPQFGKCDYFYLFRK